MPNHFLESQLSPFRAFIPFLVIIAAIYAWLGFLFRSVAVSWDEDVLLANGQLLSVHRAVTYGADGYGRSGQGGMRDQTIRFSHNGNEIEWKSQDHWPIVYMPEILDIVNGVPVLTIPVHRWEPCEKYGFPHEGLAAFGYRNEHWERMDFATVPVDLKVNLLRSTHAIQYWDEYKGKRITPTLKQKLEQNSWGPGQGQTIPEISKFYAAIEDSCARMHPLPDPVFDAAKLKNAAAEVNAKNVVAHVVSSSTHSETITAGGFRQGKGNWTGEGFMRGSCTGVVDRIEPIRQYDEKGGWNLIGQSLMLKNGNRVPMLHSNSNSLAYLDPVTCDKKKIYAIRHIRKDQLIIHRFTHAGTLIDALRITLPETDNFFTQEKRPQIWDMAIQNEQLSFSLGVYSYTGTADQGGQLEQRLNYVVQLPNGLNAD